MSKWEQMQEAGAIRDELQKAIPLVEWSLHDTHFGYEVHGKVSGTEITFVDADGDRWRARLTVEQRARTTNRSDRTTAARTVLRGAAGRLRQMATALEEAAKEPGATEAPFEEGT